MGSLAGPILPGNQNMDHQPNPTQSKRFPWIFHRRLVKFNSPSYSHTPIFTISNASYSKSNEWTLKKQSTVQTTYPSEHKLTNTVVSRLPMRPAPCPFTRIIQSKSLVIRSPQPPLCVRVCVYRPGMIRPW